MDAGIRRGRGCRQLPQLRPWGFLRASPAPLGTCDESQAGWFGGGPWLRRGISVVGAGNRPTIVVYAIRHGAGLESVKGPGLNQEKSHV